MSVALPSVSDGRVDAQEATVSITVDPVNDPPIVVDDSMTTDEDTPVTVPVLANDDDKADGGVLDPATVKVTSGPGNGAATVNASGEIVYAPAANFNGNDSFTYEVCDTGLPLPALCGSATVAITIRPVNDPPVAALDTYAVNEDTLLTIAAPGVLGNDTDPDNGDLLTAILVSSPGNGSLKLNANGSFTYTPNPNVNGSDSFSYKTRDAAGAESSVVTVALTVNAVNDPPTISMAAGGQCTGDTPRGLMGLLIADVDNAVDTLLLSGSAADPSLVPTGNIVFGGSGAARTVTITAIPKANPSSTLVTITVRDGQSGTATLGLNIMVGTNKKETFTGAAGPDLIFALKGDDTLSGNNGDDLLCAGSGNDQLDSGNGNDTLDGGDGKDTLSGGNGDDLLTGGEGADSFSGGAGADRATDFQVNQGDTQDGTVEITTPGAAALAAATAGSEESPAAQEPVVVEEPTAHEHSADEAQDVETPSSAQLTQRLFLPLIGSGLAEMDNHELFAPANPGASQQSPEDARSADERRDQAQGGSEQQPTPIFLPLVAR